MSVGIGRIVHYVLTSADVEMVQKLRYEQVDGQPEGIVKPAGIGNPVSAGQHVPLIITAVWPNEFGEGAVGINGQVLLDGNDSLWITSVAEGTDPGTWHWPERLV